MLFKRHITLIICSLGFEVPNTAAISRGIQTHPALIVLCYPILCLPFVHLCLSLWAAWPWNPLVPLGSGARHPRFATLLSKPLVMAALAPAVAACAHSGRPAQSLSRPIYLTQTRASRPSPAYLSSAWFSIGSSPVPLHAGSRDEMRGKGISEWS